MNQHLVLIIGYGWIYSFMNAHIFISIITAIKLDKTAVVHKYRNIVPWWIAVHPERNIAFTASLVRINRCCEHSKEYPSKRNSSQPRKFSFDLAFKNTRINTHRLEWSQWVWYSKFTAHIAESMERNPLTNHFHILHTKLILHLQLNNLHIVL